MWEKNLKKRVACSVTSVMFDFATLWTVAHQAPLSLGFSRWEYWSGLPCPPPGHLPDLGIKFVSVYISFSAGRFFTYWAIREARKSGYMYKLNKILPLGGKMNWIHIHPCGSLFFKKIVIKWSTQAMVSFKKISMKIIARMRDKPITCFSLSHMLIGIPVSQTMITEEGLWTLFLNKTECGNKKLQWKK